MREHAKIEASGKLHRPVAGPILVTEVLPRPRRAGPVERAPAATLDIAIGKIGGRAGANRRSGKSIGVKVGRGVAPKLTYSGFVTVAGELPLEDKADLMAIMSVSESTLDRIHRSKRDLDVTESDRLLRALRIQSQAEELFGSRDGAQQWLLEENPSLGGVRPIDLLGSDASTHEAEMVLNRVRYGTLA